MVIFKPAIGRESRGTTDADGHYVLSYNPELKGAVTGEHTVIISTRTESHPVESVPSMYFRSGELTAKVEPGKNKIDFGLDSSPKE
jgi:hypothetical protein